MGETTSGFRKMLSMPIIYNFFQNIMGAEKVRLSFVQNQIRPHYGMTILDIGCGTSEILTFMPEIDYYGFDVCNAYIEEARKRFGEKRVYFKCGPINHESLNSLPLFDVVIMIGVLHHLDDNEVKSLFKLLQPKIKFNGRLVTIDPCYCSRQNPIARFIISKDRGQNVRNYDDYLKLPAIQFTKVKGTLKHKAWIPYTHCIMECSP